MFVYWRAYNKGSSHASPKFISTTSVHFKDMVLWSRRRSTMYASVSLAKSPQNRNLGRQTGSSRPHCGKYACVRRWLFQRMITVALRNPVPECRESQQNGERRDCSSVEVSGRYAYACTTLLAPVVWVTLRRLFHSLGLRCRHLVAGCVAINLANLLGSSITALTVRRFANISPYGVI